MLIEAGRTRLISVVTLLIGLLMVSKVDAHGGHGGHSGGHSAGHASRAPHFSKPPRSFRAPRVSHSTGSAFANTSARANTNARRTNTSVAHGKANGTQSRGVSTQALAHNARSSASGTATGVSGTTANGALTTAGAASNSRFPNAYTYGTGNGARQYRAYGYGRGYQNRSYGRGYGYGRSQGNNRAIVGRLRSVHSSLARVDHDYQGHRVRAMRAISMAIRQLSHRSMSYGGMGVSSNSNNGRGMGMRQGRGGMNGGNNRRHQPMSQAQSDSRMSQSLRVLQGVNMQFGSQGNSTTGHGRASGHIQQAIHELNVALSIR